MGQWGEWKLLSGWLPVLKRGLPRNVLVGPGDDAAVLKVGDERWVVTTDILVEKVHFERSWTSGEDLGHKTLAVNLSDLAAMGNVRPMFGVLSAGLPAGLPVSFMGGFFRGFRRLAKRHGFHLVGGDTVRSEQLVFSLTAFGRAGKKDRVVLRGGARAGDFLLATGTLGDAAAGLALCTAKSDGLSPVHQSFLLRRFKRPEPRLELARVLAKRITALLDSSDGLWKSAELLCDASGTGAEIWTDRLPLSPALRAWAARSRRNPLDVALTGGEDYELVMAAKPREAQWIVSHGLATIVGRMAPKRRGLRALENGKSRRVPSGYEHFT